MGLGFITRITKWYQIHAFGIILVQVAIVIIWTWLRVKSLWFPQLYTSITSPHLRVRATWIRTCWGDNNRIFRPMFEWNVGSIILTIIGWKGIEVLNVCKWCIECKYICKENKRIIKDDKLQTLGISFSIPSGVATVGGGVHRAPKCLATTTLCGLRAR